MVASIPRVLLIAVDLVACNLVVLQMPAAARAEECNDWNEQPVDAPHRPGWEIAMTFLLPHPRPRMGLEQTQLHVDDRRGVVVLARLGGVELDPAEVFGTDKAVLAGADQSGRRAMVTVERMAIETLCDEHVLRQGVLDRHDRPVAVETAEDDMSDRRARWNRRLDDHAIEGLEGDPLPVQVGGRPPSHAVKVGGELSAGKRRELGQWQGEGFAHGAADLDHRIDGDSGRGAVEVRTEAREPSEVKGSASGSGPDGPSRRSGGNRSRSVGTLEPRPASASSQPRSSPSFRRITKSVRTAQEELCDGSNEAICCTSRGKSSGPPTPGSAHTSSSRKSWVSSWIRQGREVCAVFGSLIRGPRVAGRASCRRTAGSCGGLSGPAP